MGGVDFSVLHVGGSPTDSNTLIKGQYEGIDFEYLPKSFKKAKNRLLRIYQYLSGFVLVIKRIIQQSKSNPKLCVYVFLGPGLLEILFCAFLRLIKIPFVHEINEWWPGNNSVSKLAQWFRAGHCLSLSNGTIVISLAIEERLRSIAKRKNIKNNILRIPVLVDVAKYDKIADNKTALKVDSPYILWCGDIKGYMRDVHFIINVISEVLNRGVDCRLVLAGAISKETEESIKVFMCKHGIQNNKVVLTGYVPDDALYALMKQSNALLLPLWNDDRSETRFPTKLGDYLLSGRPVITCGIGDLRNFLLDEETAFLCISTDSSLFADKICKAINDPHLADTVGHAGKAQAINIMNYRKYSYVFADFFCKNASFKQI